MYNIIIVEDEDIIRHGIIKSIPWNNLEFKIVGQAVNGLEAINIIKSKQVDVVITDIRMDGMDGIELAEYIYTYYSDIKVVILTGYEDVEYLKKAIKSNVVDYLLKPTGSEQVIKVLKNIKSILDEEQKKKNEYNELKKQLEENMPYMRERFLNELVKGYYTNEKYLKQKLIDYKIKFNGNYYLAIVMQIDDYYIITKDYNEEKIHYLKNTVLLIANNIFSGEELGIFFRGNNDDIIGIYNCSNNNIKEYILDIQRVVFKKLQITVSFGIGEKCKLTKIHLSYCQGNEALKQKIFLGEDSIIIYEDIKQSKPSEYVTYTFNRDKIVNIIFYNAQGNISNILDEVFNKFENNIVCKPDYINKLCLELLFFISRYARRFNVIMEKILKTKNTFYSDIYKLDSLSSKRNWICDILYEIKNKVNEIHKTNTNDIIKKAKDYVKINFCNNDISLNTVSNQINKNPTYFSKLFKSKTGENFIDYLTRLRMEKAMHLLQSDKMKVYEISSDIGYADVSHFNRTFKKYVGISPIEYRKLYNGQKGEN